MAERRERGRGARRTAAIMALVSAAAGCTPMDDVLQALFGRSMRSQSAFETYEHPLGPPDGAVPFAAGNFPPGPGAVNIGEAAVAEIPAPATQEQLFQQLPEITGITNPVPPTAASLARGEVVFNRACSPCHGTAGDGAGPVTRAGIPPFSLLTPQAASYTDGYLYTLIRIGRGIMPAYGHQIGHFDRWHIVNYLRELQGPLVPPPGGTEQPDPAEAPAEEE
ncbi:MAG: cytochrome c [Gammaproteobacteria bacterium]|nr:cytochrome c [Gammaproteobacteria bacterium]